MSDDKKTFVAEYFSAYRPEGAAFIGIIPEGNVDQTLGEKLRAPKVMKDDLEAKGWTLQPVSTPWMKRGYYAQATQENIALAEQFASLREDYLEHYGKTAKTSTARTAAQKAVDSLVKFVASQNKARAEKIVAVLAMKGCENLDRVAVVSMLEKIEAVKSDAVLANPTIRQALANAE